MKFSFSAIAIAASFAFVNAQDLTGIPTCALACFATAVPSAGCSLTDTTCQCTTGKDKITESITACVPTKCSMEDIAKLAPAVESLCAKAGVTVSNLPTAVSTSGGSASRTASVTGSATSSASAAAQSTGAATANGVSYGLAAGIMGVAAWL